MTWKQIVACMANYKSEMNPHLYLAILATISVFLVILGFLIQEAQNKKLTSRRYSLYLPLRVRLIEGFPARRHPT